MVFLHVEAGISHKSSLPLSYFLCFSAYLWGESRKRSSDVCFSCGKKSTLYPPRPPPLPHPKYCPLRRLSDQSVHTNVHCSVLLLHSFEMMKTPPLPNTPHLYSGALADYTAASVDFNLITAVINLKGLHCCFCFWK